ncbi:Na/Pi symporter [Belliella sp. R4-6]|uniref:Na/Pi symporter n=1 Tax=Belliella alkalica TaxID=1730871 RepID=A0ABS9VE68_9BACT|nr:Na/Pi symporter [Belliella alkalica]MCH7414688.1 Na/Pi symporter [Belliella alkalica]
MEQEIFDTWKFIAGIGLFLWGMNQLEMSIKDMAGKSFRNLLQKSTDSAWKGILIGASITAVLQSSSLVTLMVLAFLGAGVINLKNSIGVILGANLGTTITAWIVATLGFKFSVAAFSMPFLGIGSLMFLFFSSRPFLKNIGAFAVGFGLLFLGLDFMKTAIEAVADQIDLRAFSAYGLWIYLVIGIVITALIQSSSAMVVIVLSAISSGVIDLTAGAVLIIGANIGTTVTVGIGSVNGTADKKRLALAHFLFNAVTGLIVFIFIDKIIFYTMSFFSIKDPLMELVLLNSIINLFGIFLFYPLISPLETWLRSKFESQEVKNASVYIHKVNKEVPEAATTALEKDVKLAIEMTSDFIMKIWENGNIESKKTSLWKKIIRQPFDLMSQYKEIKALEDELTAYHLSLQGENLDLYLANKTTSIMLALRMCVYAAKDFKDVLHNILEMEESEDEFVKDLNFSLKTYISEVLHKVEKYSRLDEVAEAPDWIREHDEKYQALISNLYQKAQKRQIDFPMSTLTNVIKQVISGLDNFGSAIIHLKHLEKSVIDK